MHVLGQRNRYVCAQGKITHTNNTQRFGRVCLRGGFRDDFALSTSDPSTHMSLTGGVVIAVVANVYCTALTWLARIDSSLRLARGKKN